MSAIDERKRELRKHFKQIRRDLGEEKRTRIDRAIAKKVLALSECQTADVVLPYLSVGDEVDTRLLIREAWTANKTVAIPRVVGTRKMSWHVIDDFDHLEMSAMHVEEPVSTAPVLNPAEEAAAGKRLLALVPGLTFDPNGYRLGYGGGFYDSFLTTLNELDGISVGLVREVQLSDDLAALGVLDVHDKAVDLVISEARTLRSV